eukprot:761233-Hanusia_phi.AAC.1
MAEEAMLDVARDVNTEGQFQQAANTYSQSLIFISLTDKDARSKGSGLSQTAQMGSSTGRLGLPAAQYKARALYLRAMARAVIPGVCCPAEKAITGEGRIRSCY